MTAKKKQSVPVRSMDDQPVFTHEEVDVRAIVIRWDALHEAPVVHLGSVDQWTAHAWLAAAAAAMSERMTEIMFEED